VTELRDKTKDAEREAERRSERRLDLPDFSVGQPIPGTLFSPRRKRRMILTPWQFPTTGILRFPDAAASSYIVVGTLPFDWIVDTPLEFHIGLANENVGGSPVARMESSIHIYPDHITPATRYNIETAVAADVTVTRWVNTEWVRTVDPSVFPAGMSFDGSVIWSVTRQGAHANDTVNAQPVDGWGGAWLEYYGTDDYLNRLGE